MCSIEGIALQRGVATQVDIPTLNPLYPMIPSFALGVFPQNGRIDGDMMALRWAIMDDCLEHFGMYVIAHCTDGDSAHMTAMRRRQYGPVAKIAGSSAALVVDSNDSDDDSDDEDDNPCDTPPPASSPSLSSATETYHRQPHNQVFSFPIPSLSGGADK